MDCISGKILDRNIGEIKTRVMALSSNIRDVFVGWDDITVILEKSLVPWYYVLKDKARQEKFKKAAYYAGWYSAVAGQEEKAKKQADTRKAKIIRLRDKILIEAYNILEKNEDMSVWGDLYLFIQFGDKAILERRFKNDKNEFINGDCDYGGGYLYGGGSINREKIPQSSEPKDIKGD